MPNIRTDLLSLTTDDLFALTNRGNVKRAIRELDAGKLTCEFQVEDTSQLTVQWSDGCDVQVREGKTTLTAYLQDMKGRGIVGFTAILKKKQSYPDWNPDEAVPHLLRLCIAMKLANDLA